MTGRRIAMLALATGLGAALLWASIEASLAQKRYSRCRYITVQSKYTAESVSGCVRYGRNGPEVQLPSGGWVRCEFGCANTLRTQTVDFWRWIEDNSIR